MANHDFDDYDYSDDQDSYDDLDFEDSREELKRARKMKKEMVRKELDRRMDMLRLKEMIEGYEAEDFD